ncbi:hypothetical protein [Limosilactobacillus walteri]|uniref:YSIRK-type signal peptide-containing protein n=1 Tax=Limosilactobacillus walteri TaxID=2268022 RepID=A0ABR8P707_9LACO|nr:hypothetical protein [Limosilactobacillus walteri]MBD5806467.1 hypothetical protein [Limosilactobacillus walteri]
MLSSNNQSGQITAAVANDQRKAVKKLTVGVSSILLGFAFAGATTAHADTTTQPVDDAEHISATAANQTINNSAQVLKTAAATSATDVNSAATSTMQNSASSVNSAVAAASAVSNTSDTVAATSQSTSTKSGEQQAATAADNYEAAVNATLKEVTPSSTPASASDVANSASTAQTASSAASQSSQAQASTAIENPEVAAVPMTNYDVQPYSQAQREANAQAGLKIATDFVNILTAPTLTAKIGQGITFIKDTVNLITRHPLAYQRYQCMTARQIRLANQQHALALKQKQMEAQHKAQWKINFIISQQRFLANWQQRLAIQRQTMVGYLRANTNISSFAFA